MSTAKTIEKTTGGAETLKINITSPVPMKYQDIEVKKLSIIIGPNGSGKTFITVLVWCFSLIAQTIVMAGLSGSNLVLYIQYILDHAFSDQNIDGDIAMTFESGCSIGVTFEKGKVISAFPHNFEGINTTMNIRYLSAAMRTFTAISHYLRLRLINKKSGLSNEQLVEKMCEAYKLYDIMYLESLILKMPILFVKDIQEAFKDFGIDPTITGIAIDEEKCDFYTISPKGNRYLTTYGAGEQSIFNMLLGSM